MRWIILIIVLLIIETYAYQAFRTLIKSKKILNGYKILNLLVLAFIVYSFTKFERSVGQTQYTLFTLGLLLLVYLPKIFLVVVMLAEDVFRILKAVVRFFIKPKEEKNTFPNRRKFVSQIALGLAAIPFLSLIYGVVIGRYNFKVIKQRIYFPDLPDAFDGFKITQISDVHSGSFDNPEKIEYAIGLINEQEADLILFTGDIVNTHAKEMHPWMETFNKIKSYNYGKFAVLGNHDYGEYVDWPSPAAKEKNFNAIKSLYGEIGFKLLLNEHVFINKGEDRIALVGVENWGKGFKQAGDLKLASKEVSKDDFKILMSHDPSHWEAEVKNHPKHFQLTFSGHTHGMQFGIEIPGYFKWSLAQYMYKQWAGLYENLGRYIYVNRGFGFHAYPGRVGIMPEITVVELKKGKNIA
ncbi:MAG: metallophosphoesterase [Bacteroidota bacterium]